MKHYSLISLLIFAVIAYGCGIHKAAPGRDVAVRDSVVERVRIITHTDFIPVVVRMEIPQISEIRRGLRDSTDIIENDYAVSTVTVHPDGTFDHGLDTKPQCLEQTVDVPVQVSDTSRTTESAHSENVTRTIEVNVLKWWQSALIWLGASALAIGLLIIVIRCFNFRIINN